MAPSASDRQRRLGLLLTAGGASLFALKGIVIKLSYNHGIDVLSLMALRMGLAVPLYLLIAAVLATRPGTPLSPRQWIAVSACGLCGYHLASYLDLAGLQYVSAGLERLILYIYPTLVLLYGRLLFGRRIQAAEVIAALVCYLGLALVMAEDVRLYSGQVVLGGLLVLGSAAAFALFIVLSGRLIPKVGSMRFTCYAMTAAGLGIAVHYMLTGTADLTGFSAEVYLLALVLAVFCTMLPSFMTAAGIGRIGAERAALVGMVGPPATMGLGYILLGEAVTLAHLAGSALILAGVFYIGMNKPKPAAAREPGSSPAPG